MDGRWIKVFSAQAVTSTTTNSDSSYIPLFAVQDNNPFPGSPSGTTIKNMRGAALDGMLAMVSIATSSPAAAVTVTAKLMASADGTSTGPLFNITGGSFTPTTTGTEMLKISGPNPHWLMGRISVASATTCTATVDLWVQAKE